MEALNRDRGEPRGSRPPTPPGIRFRTKAVRLVRQSVSRLAGGYPVVGNKSWAGQVGEPDCD